MLKRAILALLLITVLPGTFAFAAGSAQSGISLYANGKFEAAAVQFQSQLQTNPKDSVAHYYLALCYQKLIRLKDAASEYSLALKYSSDKKLSSYAQSGLASCSACTTSTRASSSPSSSNAKDSIGEEKDAINKEAEKQVAEIDRRLDDEIKKIRTDCLAQMNSIPRYTQLSVRFPTRVANPDYSVAIQNIQLEADQNIAQAKAAADRDKKDILAGSSARVAALESSMAYRSRTIDPQAASKQAEQSPAMRTATSAYSRSSEEADRIMKEAQNSIADIDARAQAAVEPIQADAAARVAQIPRTIPVVFGMARTRMIMNPDYETLAGSIEEEANEKIKKIRDAAEHDKKAVIELAQKRAESYTSTATGIKSQLAHPGKSIQLVPNGNSLYGRHYVNFGDGNDESVSQIQPLKAQPPKRLEQSAQAKSTNDQLPEK